MFQSLILSTAVPTIIGFSLWREVSLALWVGSGQNRSYSSSSLSCLQFYPRVLAELVDLQGFYEPDTVELIGWIR